MPNQNFSENQIEYLSWNLMASLLGFISEDVCIGDLHPGGGQYDCLSLISKAPAPILMLNRNGTSASSGNNLVHGIWDRAEKQGYRDTALHILNTVQAPMDEMNESRRVDLILSCRRIARWVKIESNGLGKATCCWVDDPSFVGPSNYFLDQVAIPESWKVDYGPYSPSNWTAWLYALSIDEKVQGLVNMRTGEAIVGNGEIWTYWFDQLPEEE